MKRNIRSPHRKIINRRIYLPTKPRHHLHRPRRPPLPRNWNPSKHPRLAVRKPPCTSIPLTLIHMSKSLEIITYQGAIASKINPT
ncbi:hypothetical protein P171DRAFT_437232 [Karstenula rhodostoma CBS 690.94]|uniref:Uncharacterized protein n=1 Tax=Karstenula rhodostoma CBS 690.94 TaxID=1392251 RepID=A0A9P4U6I6_9PLEO|nr:hypothetical protein P171DRAFT_437232 [Karstenula rhodostoma CBS 690.94]